MTARVPFADLRAQHGPPREEILAAWAEVLDDAAFVSGRHVEAFEREFAHATGTEHAVAVSSGTDALVLGIRALGLASGDRVVVPTNSFIATAEAVSIAGGVPHLVDCDGTSNIDVEQAAAAAQGAAGIIAVHLYGRPADMVALRAAADAAGCWLLEDAAQAHGAELDGRPAGTLGDAAAFSFYPGKNLGAPGEGGAVTTSDARVAAVVRQLRSHGEVERYRSALVGYNARLPELMAAALRIKLPHLARWTAARRALATQYHDLLSDVPGVRLPAPDSTAVRSSHHLFVIEVDDRDVVRETLQLAGIETGLHYPVPIHLQDAYAELGHGLGSFPVSERKASRLLSLPMYAELQATEVAVVSAALRDAIASTQR
jgi:dTDP-4-amino-4,6-dideoxygalactose transaminase